MADNSPFRTTSQADGDTDSPTPRPGVVGALRDLSDNLTQLVQKQVALVRLEVSREASEAGSRSAQLLLFAGIGLVGYFLINVAIVCLAGYLAGYGGMSLSALSLGMIHLIVAFVQIRRQMEAFEQQQARLESKAETLAANDTSGPPQIDTEVESQESK